MTWQPSISLYPRSLSHPSIQLYDDDNLWVNGTTAVPSRALHRGDPATYCEIPKSKSPIALQVPVKIPVPSMQRPCKTRPKTSYQALKEHKLTKTRWKSPDATRYPSLLGRVSQAISGGAPNRAGLASTRWASDPVPDRRRSLNIPRMSDFCTLLDFNTAFTVPIYNIMLHFRADLFVPLTFSASNICNP